jgi:hypothetical protein
MQMGRSRILLIGLWFSLIGDESLHPIINNYCAAHLNHARRHARLDRKVASPVAAATVVGADVVTGGVVVVAGVVDVDVILDLLIQYQQLPNCNQLAF